MQLTFEFLFNLFPIGCAIGTTIYQVARARNELEKQIAKNAELLARNQYSNTYEFDKKITMIDHTVDREILQMNGRIDATFHRLERLENAIHDLNEYLEKNGDFQTRRGLREK